MSMKAGFGLKVVLPIRITSSTTPAARRGADRGEIRMVVRHVVSAEGCRPPPTR